MAKEQHFHLVFQFLIFEFAARLEYLEATTTDAANIEI
jgi:hypothetical protein